MTAAAKQRKDDMHVTHEACARMRASSLRWILGIIAAIVVTAGGWTLAHTVNHGVRDGEVITNQKVLETKVIAIKEDVSEIKTMVMTLQTGNKSE